MDRIGNGQWYRKEDITVKIEVQTHKRNGQTEQTVVGVKSKGEEVRLSEDLKVFRCVQS